MRKLKWNKQHYFDMVATKNQCKIPQAVITMLGDYTHGYWTCRRRPTWSSQNLCQSGMYIGYSIHAIVFISKWQENQVLIHAGTLNLSFSVHLTYFHLYACFSATGESLYHTNMMHLTMFPFQWCRLWANIPSPLNLISLCRLEYWP